MSDRSKLFLALSFFALVTVLGGASRADALSQTPLRLIAIGFIVAGLWSANRVRLRKYSTLFAFFGLVALVPALQLFPLPYDLWASLPSMKFYAAVVDTLGIEHAARPLTLVPDATRNALLSLLIPLAMLIIAAQVPVERHTQFGLAIVVIAIVDIVLGFAQAAGGNGSALRYYAITNDDSMVGVFANRNHHAVMLALTLPIIAALPIGLGSNATWRRAAHPLSALAIVLVLLTILITGSRAGLITAAIGMLGGALVYGSMARARLKKNARADMRGTKIARLAMNPGSVLAAAVIAIAAAVVSFANAPAMQRLIKTNSAEEDRARLLDPILEMTQALLPFGGGVGSFSTLFPRFEPVDMLRTVYLNHAHMDALELVTEGGIPSALLLIAFLIWWARKSIMAWRAPVSTSLAGNLGRIGTVTTGIVMIASLVDYPLRTPLHMIIFVIGCVWLHRSGVNRVAAG